MKNGVAATVGAAIAGLLVLVFALVGVVSRREGFDVKVLDWQLVIIGVGIITIALALRIRWLYPPEQPVLQPTI